MGFFPIQLISFFILSNSIFTINLTFMNYIQKKNSEKQ